MNKVIRYIRCLFGYDDKTKQLVYDDGSFIVYINAQGCWNYIKALENRIKELEASNDGDW